MKDTLKDAKYRGLRSGPSVVNSVQLGIKDLGDQRASKCNTATGP